MRIFYLPGRGISGHFSITGMIQSVALLVLLSGTFSSFAQSGSRIAHEIDALGSVYKSLQEVTPLVSHRQRTGVTNKASQIAPDAKFYSMDAGIVDMVLSNAPQHLYLEMPFGNVQLKMKLRRAEIFTSDFRLYTGSDPRNPFPYHRGQYYWGIVEGYGSSLVALSFSQSEIMGFIQLDADNYTLGKLENDPDNLHILYKTEDLKAESGVSCHVDDSFYDDITESPAGYSRSSSNCVKMCIHVDYDIYVQKGGVQQAADYVNGAFSQVAIMYANEAINFTVNEMVVWNTADPFTGPTTSNYLTQFRNYLGGNYNGDLAHLVGYNGGGGVAYLDVLCNSYYGVGYSGIQSSYQNVPTYSWTVEVLTHEIGHNLGSQHTHACAWNGNNTALDGCGPAAGYSEGCNAPLPPSGTVMSYCHLISGVGINFNNGFGPQPGDRIRNKVYNAACLTSCGPPIQFDAGITAINAPIAFPCESSTAPVVVMKNFGAATLTNVTIKYQVDNGPVSNYAWTGSLSQNQSVTVTLPAISYSVGVHTFKAYTFAPNGENDEVNSNNESTKSFTYFLDWCICNAATASLSPNPLNHTGIGSSNASVSFAPGIKRPEFVISGLNAKTNGGQNARFTDAVTVTYVDGNGNNQNYGTFYGDQQSTVNVNIQSFVNSISVSLSNGLNNNYTGTLSVSFNTVNYCAPGAGCADADNDGVCDVDDVCPGFNDALIGTACDDGNACTENDTYTVLCLCAGVPIPLCEGCDEVTSQFSPNPLTHSGSGQSTSLVTLPVNQSEPSFVISGLDARINGNPGNRYIEQVTVSYVNGSGNTIVYGTFRGDQVSTVNVNITGLVQSVLLSLADAYDGNSSTLMSVSMSAVTSCNGGAALENLTSDTQIILYPNPASEEVFIRLGSVYGQTIVHVYDAIGRIVGSHTFEEVKVLRIPLDQIIRESGQLLFLDIQADGKRLGMKTVLVIE